MQERKETCNCQTVIAKCFICSALCLHDHNVFISNKNLIGAPYARVLIENNTYIVIAQIHSFLVTLLS